mmetsp:Transcript_5768/g.12651  ORF Transcript_5768/g.12651 Transcript_5768/m.12651 type:complete len:1022 (+) Transcript_5768:111-3176(+)
MNNFPQPPRQSSNGHNHASSSSSQQTHHSSQQQAPPPPPPPPPPSPPSSLQLQITNKSSFHFRSDIHHQRRDAHPCGMLHVSKRQVFNSSGHEIGREEQAFAWIQHRFSNEDKVQRVIEHLVGYGFDGTRLVFLPFSSLEGWMFRYPHACPYIVLDNDGTIKGMPYFDQCIPNSQNNFNNDQTSDNHNIHIPKIITDATQSTCAACRNGANSKTNDDSNHNSRPTKKQRRTKSSKLLPTGTLLDPQRNQLHIEIYHYFTWLHTQLLQIEANVVTNQTTGTTLVNGARQIRRAGISLPAMQNLITKLEGTFKHVGEYKKELAMVERQQREEEEKRRRRNNRVNDNENEEEVAMMDVDEEGSNTQDIATNDNDNNDNGNNDEEGGATTATNNDSEKENNDKQGAVSASNSASTTNANDSEKENDTPTKPKPLPLLEQSLQENLQQIVNEIQKQKEDNLLLQPPPPLLLSSSPNNNTNSSGNNNNNNNSNNNSSSNITNTIIIGIACGVAVFTALAAMFFVYHRKRRGSYYGGPPTLPPSIIQYNKKSSKDHVSALGDLSTPEYDEENPPEQPPSILKPTNTMPFLPPPEQLTRPRSLSFNAPKGRDQRRSPSLPPMRVGARSNGSSGSPSRHSPPHRQDLSNSWHAYNNSGGGQPESPERNNGQTSETIERELHSLRMAMQNCPKNSPTWLLLNSYLSRTRKELGESLRDESGHSLSPRSDNEEEKDQQLMQYDPRMMQGIPHPPPHGVPHRRASGGSALALSLAGGGLGTSSNMIIDDGNKGNGSKSNIVVGMKLYIDNSQTKCFYTGQIDVESRLPHGLGTLRGDNGTMLEGHWDGGRLMKREGGSMLNGSNIAWSQEIQTSHLPMARKYVEIQLTSSSAGNNKEPKFELSFESLGTEDDGQFSLESFLDLMDDDLMEDDSIIAMIDDDTEGSVEVTAGGGANVRMKERKKKNKKRFNQGSIASSMASTATFVSHPDADKIYEDMDGMMTKFQDYGNDDDEVSSKDSFLVFEDTKHDDDPK